MLRRLRTVALAIRAEPPGVAGGVSLASTADSPSRINRPLPQAVLTRPYLQFIDFRRQHEIAFAEPVDLVRPDRHVGFAPAKADVRMVALLFCQIAHAVNEFETFAKIFEAIEPLQMMFVNHLPAFELRQKLFYFLALHGRQIGRASCRERV